MSITLTGKEIRDLAEFAGFDVTWDKENGALTMEIEYVVMECGKEGIENDDGEREFYDHFAYLAEYPEEGCHPLGDKKP